MKALLSLAGVAVCAVVAGGSAYGRVQPQASTPPAPVTTSAAEMAHTFSTLKGYTRPSQDSTMSFTFPVEIAQILVKGGQKVKRGDLLVRGRDEEYRHQRDLQKLLAESDLDIQRAQAALDQANIELEGHTKARGSGGASALDLARAETNVRLKAVELEITKLQREQQVMQLALRESQLVRLQLRAPFDGRVDRITGDVGVVKRETEPVVRVVATDPLWIDVTPSTRDSLMLKMKTGDRAWVVLDVPEQPEVLVGRVIELAADAEFGADIRRVRIEVSNRKDWPSGVTAWVRFTEPTGEWAGRIFDETEPKTSDAVAQSKGGAPQ